MFSSNRSPRTAVASVAILALSSGVAISSAERSTKAKSAPDQQVAKLLQERRSILQELVKASIDDYRVGRSDIGSVGKAQQQLLLVELDLAAGHDERVKVLEESAELAQSVEKIADAQFRAGHGTRVDVLQSQADRLNVEIALARERQRSE